MTAAVLAAVASGCAVGPNFKRPEAPPSAYTVPSLPAGSQSLSYGGDTSADWYTVFRSQAIHDLVRDAVAANPDLEAARHSLSAAQWELRAVAGSALPHLELDGRVSRARVNGSFLYEPIETLQVTANQFNIGPALAYDLDVFGRIRRTIESQAAQTAQARDQALNVYITVVDQVVLTAFDYAATAEQIAVTRQLVDELEAQYKLTSTLEDAGKITRSDTLQAQAQLESTRATLPNLEKQQDVYRNALLRLTGKPPAGGAVPQLALHEFTLPSQLPVSVPSQLIRQRPDILAAEDALHQASAQIGVAEAARFPDINISGEYAQQSIRTSDLFTKAGGIWSVGGSLTAPLFEGGTLRAREKAARERFEQAAAQYRSSVIAAFGEVADALQALQHDADSYQAHSAALDAARANRDLQRDLFQQGKVSELVVLTAEQEYQNETLSQVQADVQRFTDVATLFHALGGGWWNAKGDPLNAESGHE